MKPFNIKKRIKLKLQQFFHKLFCFIFNHSLVKIRNLNIGGSLYICVHCEKKLAIHHARQQVIEWDQELQDLEDDIGKLYDKS